SASRCRGVRGGLDAGRPAQAVADARRQGLPRRVRLLDDGLRDSGWTGRQTRRSVTRGVRDGWRRVVPDDGAGDRDMDAGGRDALVAAKKAERTVVIHVIADRYEGVPAYDSWWEVPVAEVSESADVEKAQAEHQRDQARRRWHL